MEFSWSTTGISYTMDGLFSGSGSANSRQSCGLSIHCQVLLLLEFAVSGTQGWMTSKRRMNANECQSNNSMPLNASRSQCECNALGLVLLICETQFLSQSQSQSQIAIPESQIPNPNSSSNSTFLSLSIPTTPNSNPSRDSPDPTSGCRLIMPSVLATPSALPSLGPLTDTLGSNSICYRKKHNFY